MKNYLLSVIILFTSNVSIGQLNILPGTQWINSGAAVVVFHDIDLVNNGTITAGSSLAKFTGSINTVISGTTASSFNELEMAKAANSKLSLVNNITVANRVIFSSGQFDLNQHDLTLAPAAYLFNETENSRITGTNGGEISITVTLNSPAGSNPGNLGAVITSASNLGTVVIKRGHKPQSGTGLTGSIQRYFDIVPANNAALNATFRYYYFDAEMNGQAEALLKMYRSADAGSSWTNQNYSSRSAVENYVEQTGINSFSRWTVSSSGTTLPITGLEFNAKRINKNSVQLSWKTNQEFNNRGFYVERKKENESNFITTGFVGSLAAGGNSNLPLHYVKTDTNDFKGKTYYRLKQEDMDGKSTYSIIRFVAGSDDKTITLKVWPVPSQGDINVLLQGIDKEQLQVIDMNGRLIVQLPVTANTQQTISRLNKGMYMLKLAGQNDLVQKIIIE